MKKGTFLRFCLTALLGLVLTTPGRGQLPTRVKDIVEGVGGSDPNRLTAVGNTLFFVATDANGTELWKSDGTEAGTMLVKDINPTDDAFISDLTAVGNTLYFRADDGTHGVELWKSDGTAAGTVLVKDIFPNDNAFPSDLAVLNGTLYFRALNGSTGYELWKSDGTEAGTVLVKDINPTGNASPSYMTALNGALYFSADDGTHGVELWKSDGTEAGTVRVKDIFPGINTDDPNFPYPNGSFPASLKAVGSTLYFSANDGNGTALWKSDGTEAGTVLVKTIFSISDMTLVGSTLYFRANDDTHGLELWKTDGTTAGTVLIKDINPGPNDSSPELMTALGSTLIFRVTDGTSFLLLYKSDGTEAGTVLVKDLDPTSNSGGDPRDLAVFNGQIYFNGDDGVTGDELWKTDGTEAGTVQVADINPGAGGSAPERKAVVGNTLYFRASDGTTGYELWKLDATPPCQAPAITGLSPISGFACAGPQTLTVTATGGDLTYQWYRFYGLADSQPIAGATGPSLTVNLTTSASYYVVVSGSCGPSVKSSLITLTLKAPTILLTGSNPSAVCRGGSVTLSVGATGPGSLSFAWRKGAADGPIVSTASSLSIQNAQPSDAGPYFVSVTSECTTQTTQLPLTVRSVSITQQPPASVNLCSGTTTLTVGVQAVGVTPTYQWRRNGQNLFGATSASLVVPSSRPGTYTVVVSSACGNPVTSGASVVGCGNGRLSAEEPALVVAPNPVRGSEIRCRVVGLDAPTFDLTTSTGQRVGIWVKTDGWGEWVLTPHQALAAGVYGVRASEGPTRLARRVLVIE